MADHNINGDSRRAELLNVDDYRALAQSARGLTRELSLERLLNNILGTASRLTDSPETSIILPNEKQPTLYFAAATGDEADWVLSTYGVHSEKQIPIEGSKAGEVYRTGKSIVENVIQDHFGGVDHETEKITKSMVCVPLTVGSNRIGVMQVLNKVSGNYSERDRLILEYFADQASVAIRNARLMESLLAHSGLYGQSRDAEQLLKRMDELEQEAHAEMLTVLFADMRGFTQLAQSLLDPVLVQRRLSEFITMLCQSVINNDGVVNKFLGDGIMALFQGADCSVHAVESAFSMVRDFQGIKERWNDESNQQLDFLDLGVGIVTDQVILGGIGSRELRDYTAIGVAVNLSAALENEARNGRRILCDRHTYRRARDIIAQSDGPVDYVLQKPGQDLGVKYKFYSLQALGAERATAVFLSYSHEDRGFVETQLVQPLRNLDVRSWYADADIPKGALWTAQIRNAISNSTWMVVVVSKNSAKSKWVRREVDLAVAAGHLDDRIIPVIIDSSRPGEINEFLAAMQAVDVSDTDDVSAVLADRFLKG